MAILNYTTKIDSSMNELSTEQMEERIRNVIKEHYSKLFTNDDRVIVMGAGSFHHALAERLQRIAYIDTKVAMITPEMLTDICERAGRSLDEMMVAIESIRTPVKILAKEFEKAALSFKDLKGGLESTVVINNDNRPWYDVAANKGGKKRKQNYYNRQPWRK